MPTETYKTLDLNNSLQLVNSKNSKLKAVFIHNRSRSMCWVKLWNAKNLVDVNFGVTPSTMTLSASSSFLANGTEFASIYYLQDLVFNNGIIMAATKGWRDSDIEGFEVNSILGNILFD